MKQTRWLWAVAALVAAGLAWMATHDGSSVAELESGGSSVADAGSAETSATSAEPDDEARTSALDEREDVGALAAAQVRPTHRLTGRVIDEARVPVSGARVAVLDGRPDAVEARTDAEGRYVLEFTLHEATMDRLRLFAGDDAGRCSRRAALPQRGPRRRGRRARARRPGPARGIRVGRPRPRRRRAPARRPRRPDDRTQPHPGARRDDRRARRAAPHRAAVRAGLPARRTRGSGGARSSLGPARHAAHLDHDRRVARRRPRGRRSHAGADRRCTPLSSTALRRPLPAPRHPDALPDPRRVDDARRPTGPRAAHRPGGSRDLRRAAPGRRRSSARFGGGLREQPRSRRARGIPSPWTANS